MSGELGKASLDLEANLETFRRNVRDAQKDGQSLEHSLDALAAVANIAERELNRVRMDAAQAAESQAIADRIERSAGRVGRAAMEASQHLQEVKISAEQAAESDLAGDVIDRKLKDITRNANEARRATESVRLAGGVPGRSGVGVGIFGSGFGRIGLMGTAVGAGTLLSPAAGPAAAGLLAATPVLAGTAAGALGALVLAFDGVGKAIGGDKKAFDSLVPAQQQFVQEIRSLDGWLDKLKQTAAGDMFPGLSRGLHEALSPEMLASISTAVAELSHAIGQAGEAWGRYFGSPEFRSIFGPLMQDGARNIGELSDAALHLADSIGVLARDAIPLTDWMMRSLDDAARLADSWLHARDASGQLSGAMREAETSLELVGRLVGSLFNAVGALGDALYPVSKIAVKDLTDGLNALARIIENNKDEIRDIVGGALTALKQIIQTLAPLLGTMIHNADDLAHAVGGWKTAFTIILSGLLAKQLIGVADSLLGVGNSATVAEGKVAGLRAELASIAGKTFAAALVLSIIPRSNLGQQQLDKIGLGFLGTFPLIGGAETQAAALGYKAGSAFSNAMGANDIAHERSKLGAAAQALAQHGAAVAGVSHVGPSFSGNTAGIKDSLLTKVAQAAQAVGATQVVITSGARSASHNAAVGGVKNSNHLTGDAIDGYAIIGGKRVPLGQALLGVAAKYGLRSGDVAGFFNGAPDPVHVDDGANAGGVGSPFGTPPPFTKNLGPKPPKPPVIPSLVTDLLNRASENASKSKQLGNIGGTAKRYLQDELDELQAAQKDLEKLKPSTERGKQQVKAKTTEVANKIRDVQTLISKTAFATGDALLPTELRDRLAAETSKFKADSAFAQILTGKAAENYQQTLLSDIDAKRDTLQQMVDGLKAKLSDAHGKQRTEIQKELTKIQGQLADVQQQVVQTLQGTVQTLQSHVQSYMSNVQSELDFQFEQATQAMLDQAAQQFFQNGALTPLEQQLQDMQQADQLKSLTDAVNSAATPQDKAAAQRQLDEYNLQLRATEERRRADENYAAEVKRITAERKKEEDEMNRKLAELSDQFANGTGTMADLTAIAATYGLQITDQTVPDFQNLSGAVSGLQQAISSLINYISTLTGSRPTITAGASATVTQALATPLSQWTQSMADAFNAAGGDLAGLALYGGLPHAAKGAIALRPTLGIWGEAGPEALIPLHDRRAMEMLGAGSGGSNGPTTVVLEVDRRELARAAVRGITDDTSSKTKLAATLSA